MNCAVGSGCARLHRVLGDPHQLRNEAEAQPALGRSEVASRWQVRRVSISYESSRAWTRYRTALEYELGPEASLSTYLELRATPDRPLAEPFPRGTLEYRRLAIILTNLWPRLRLSNNANIW